MIRRSSDFFVGLAPYVSSCSVKRASKLITDPHQEKPADAFIPASIQKDVTISNGPEIKPVVVPLPVSNEMLNYFAKMISKGALGTQKEGAKGKFSGIGWEYLGSGAEGHSFKVGSLKNGQPVFKLKFYTSVISSSRAEAKWVKALEHWEALKNAGKYKNVAHQFYKFQSDTYFVIQSEYISKNRRDNFNKRIELSTRPGDGFLEELGDLWDGWNNPKIQGMHVDIGALKLHQ